MKLLLLKILWQRRARDEGFTLPMVIALGLVIILLGAVNITSANEENLNAITQNSRSDALAIAEIGVTRYREILDRNRSLALYDSAEWGNRTDICNSDLANFLPGSTDPDVNVNAIALNEDGTDLNNDGDSTDAFAPGSYHLVSYDYSNTNGVFDQTDDALNNDARGTLTVKGVTPNGNEAQVEVEIPILINPGDMTNLAPALWIGDNTVSNADLGNLTIGNGNIVIRDQAVTIGTPADGCRARADLPNLSSSTLPITTDSRDIPNIANVSATIAAAGTQINTSLDDGILGKVGSNPFTEDIQGSTFDAARDCSNIRDCRYYYEITTPQTFTNDVVTDGIARATVYTDNTLTIDPVGGNTIDIGSGVASNYFEIYVDNGQKITIDVSDGATVNINAFIHAPDSELEITGNGTVNINGSVWVNDFVSSANATVDITPDTSNQSTSISNLAYQFYTTANNRTAKPRIGSPTNWKTEEASN